MRRFTPIILSVIAIALATMTYSCQEQQEPRIPVEPIPPTVPAQTFSAKQYAEDSIFIDVDFVELARTMGTPQAQEKEYLDRIAKAKAAIFRFYSNVKLKNGLYECSLTDADEINVSHDVFEALSSNLKKMNREIDKARKEGKNIVVPEVTDKYLESILH